MKTEIYLLVELETLIDQGRARDTIKRVIRTYDRRDRADEDMELLTQASNLLLSVLTVPFIDS